MPIYIVLSLYCVLIIVASLIGGRLPSLVKLTHEATQILVSLVGGLMLGVSLFHMLPHAIAKLGVQQLDFVVMSMMMGLLVMFFLLRTFHFHNHDPELSGIPQCDHDHDHDDRAHHHAHPHVTSETTWMGVFVGLSIHTLIDGFILGASLQADAMHLQVRNFLGLGTFLAILLHKPLDALSITTLMQASHWSSRAQLFVNFAFAVMCPIGAICFLLGASVLVEQQTLIVGSALAFSAGVFLCISLSDLLPEMEFHSHHRVPLTLALLLGIALAWGIRLVEDANAHLPQPPPVQVEAPAIIGD